MAHTTGCSRCTGCVPVPDAARWPDFLKAAHHAWHTAHPRKRKPRGRPLVESEVTATAHILIEAAQRAGEVPTHSHLVTQLGNKYRDLEDSTLRRHATLALIESKAFHELTHEEKQFLRTRRRTLLRMPHKFDLLIPSLLQSFDRSRTFFAEAMEQVASNLVATIQQDFPEHCAAAEASGHPLNFAEIKRLYKAKAQNNTLTFQMLRPSFTPH